MNGNSNIANQRTTTVLHRAGKKRTDQNCEQLQQESLQLERHPLDLWQIIIFSPETAKKSPRVFWSTISIALPGSSWIYEGELVYTSN